MKSIDGILYELRNSAKYDKNMSLIVNDDLRDIIHYLKEYRHLWDLQKGGKIVKPEKWAENDWKKIRYMCDGECDCGAYLQDDWICCPYCGAMLIWDDRDIKAGTERTAKVIEHDASIADTDGYIYHRSEYLCSSCKKKVIGGDDYCSHCGARLDWTHMKEKKNE